MHDHETHPLLQQVPLTVSPFIQLPTATTLPYQYKQMPSTLPPSTLGITTASTTDDANNNTNNPSAPANKPRYVVSASGYTAHPDDILQACRELHAYVAQLQAKSEKELREFDERIKARELAEKRRLAPGWLDSEARLLEPERKPAEIAAQDLQAAGHEVATGGRAETGAAVPEQGQGLTEGYGHGQYMWLLQQPVQLNFHGFGDESGDSYVEGPSEMAVPDEGQELDRAFGVMQLAGKAPKLGGS
ncbi:uncharacterized protein B0T15DRAFT_524576 [Chaetomium strumarium]|uniref:Uncharacterized protein n=1 Tax=Chaetomium strumarium TaxID=1170767 RepID=A0AAJ0GZ19_9PEZI|nr:hypothetical protein B0T15DRAFT_524576 [Chaetomium strumarium]